jgi:hypothetical protein
LTNRKKIEKLAQFAIRNKISSQRFKEQSRTIDMLRKEKLLHDKWPNQVNEENIQLKQQHFDHASSIHDSQQENSGLQKSFGSN